MRQSTLSFVQEPWAGVRPVHVSVGHVRRGADPGRLRAMDVKGVGQPKVAELRGRSADLVLGHPGGIFLGGPRALDVQGWVKNPSALKSPMRKVLKKKGWMNPAFLTYILNYVWTPLIRKNILNHVFFFSHRACLNLMYIVKRFLGAGLLKGKINTFVKNQQKIYP